MQLTIECGQDGFGFIAKLEITLEDMIAVESNLSQGQRHLFNILNHPDSAISSKLMYFAELAHTFENIQADNDGKTNAG